MWNQAIDEAASAAQTAACPQCADEFTPGQTTVSGFLQNVWDTSSYPPRWRCGDWTPLEGWLHIGSDLMIGVAYFAIPATLLYFVVRRKDFPFNSLFWLFGAFILCCGVTHFMEVVIFWHPLYRLAGLIKLITAIVSIATAIVLVRVIPAALSLPALAAVNDQLRRADSMKSQFLANMSHEIRTPLTAILGFADVVKMAESDAEARDAAATIRRNGEHLLAVLNDVLDLSKIEANRLQLEWRPCHVRELGEDVIELYQAKAAAAGLQLHLQVAANLPEFVLADPTRLRQILSNLIGNAVKFTAKGYINVQLDAHRVAGHMRVVVSVRDTGIGMSAEEATQLFQPFSQGDPSTTRKFGGSGLGLAISRKLARLMDGDIDVNSSPGVGSEFTFWFPLKIPGPSDLANIGSARPRRAPELHETYELAGLHLLVVDDVADNRTLIQRLLTRAGAQVTLVADGQQAIDAILAGQPAEVIGFDAVLMDMQMPVKDGYTATRELRDRGVELPIIAITANAMKGDRQKCLEAGCSAFVAKPIQQKELIDAIQSQLGFSSDAK